MRRDPCWSDGQGYTDKELSGHGIEELQAGDHRPCFRSPPPTPKPGQVYVINDRTKNGDSRGR